MINVEILLIVLGAFAFVLLVVLIKRLSKVKVWIDSRGKENQPLVRTCYLKKGEDGTAAEVYRSGAFGKPAIGVVKIDEKSIHNRAYVEVLMTDMNDDAEKPHYRRTGYINFDQDTTVDQYGYIYKQINGKKDSEVVGYLARPSKPNVPTIYGERSWKSLWLKCVLYAYAGMPDNPEDKANSETPTGKETQKVEKLYVHSSKKNKNNTEQENVELAEQPTIIEEEKPIAEIEEQPTIADAEQPIAEAEDPSNIAKEEQTITAIEEQPTIADAEAEEQSAIVEEEQTTTEEQPDNQTDEPEQSTSTEEENPQLASDTPTPIPLEKKKMAPPMAICSYWGFHSSKKDLLPPEARAAGFALLQRYAPRQKEAEYASEQPYGWKDTALLSAFIYTILFIIVYLVNTGIFQMPLLGKDWKSAALFVSYYFVLWAIVRFIKIEAIEGANSFQPILDLFNKNLGMKAINISIIAMSLIASAFTLFYYDYDFLPLLLVIAIGVAINMSLSAANRRWKVKASFLEDTEDECEYDDEEEPQNPQGDISRSYEWDLDATYNTNRKAHGSLTLYFKAADIRDIKHLNPFFGQRKDHSDKENITYMFHFLKKYRKTFLARTNYIAYTISKLAEKNRFTPMDKLQFTLDFVQEPNIAFQVNAENKNINFYDDYIAFPDEILYEKCGDSNSKSLLAAMLFHLMGNNVLYLISRKHQHSAVGVEIKKKDLLEGWYGKADEIAVKYEDRYYIFCETTGDNFSLGAQVSGMSIDEFDEKIFLPVMEDDDEFDRENEQTTDEPRIYTWNLDSILGNKLTGHLALEFSTDEIDNLRNINPFTMYGKDNHTYSENVLSIFQYLKENQAKMNNVRQIADYIRSKVQEAGYPELDMLQFALNFVQEPNIVYVIDEKSKPIGFIKEYMRFPEEVLFDKEGDCDCKSSLTAALFMSLGYKTIFMLSDKLKHAAIGVECKDASMIAQIAPEAVDDVVLDYNGTQYIYCETTGKGFHVGQIKENESIKDFETILELSI